MYTRWAESKGYKVSPVDYKAGDITGISAATIKIEGESGLFVPNAFSPNEDGLNDTWQVVGQGVENYKLYVYSRWGELVWSSTSIDDQWDGTYKGRKLPIDVYAYILSYGNPCLGKTIIQKSGHIVIIR
jgi:gliding motility-associated-like protein